MREFVYKILPAADWERARALPEGVVPWAPVDHRDGFMHLSAGDQVRETAAAHFAGQSGLCVLEISVDDIAEGVLAWEPSRGGALFPHAYGQLPTAVVRREGPLRWAKDRGFTFPDWLPE